MQKGDFYNHNGGIIICVLSADNQGGTLIGYNLKSSNLKEGDYRTKNTGSKATAKEVRKMFNKVKKSNDNAKRWDFVNSALDVLENTKKTSDTSNEAPVHFTDKKIKTKYVNNAVPA